MSRVEEVSNTSVTVIVPLDVRRRNGRPRIVVPEGDEQCSYGARRNEPLIRAIARAWDWRRRIEAGGATTLRDIATAEGVTVPLVSRQIRLAYLAPDVLAKIVSEGTGKSSTAMVAEAALYSWGKQTISAGR